MFHFTSHGRMIEFQWSHHDLCDNSLISFGFSFWLLWGRIYTYITAYTILYTSFTKHMDCRLHYSSLLRRILLMIGTLTWVIFSFHFSFFGLKTHLCETSFRYWNLHISARKNLMFPEGSSFWIYADLCNFLMFAVGQMWSHSTSCCHPRLRRKMRVLLQKYKVCGVIDSSTFT